MKAPICSICLASDMLCKACKESLDSGKVTQLEADISREIHLLSKKSKTLENLELIKILDTQGAIIIVVPKGQAARLVGKGGVIAKQLSAKFKKRVKVVEKSESLREIIQSIIYPVPVLGLNVVYGKKREMTLVKVPKNARLLVGREELRGLVQALSGKEIEVEGQ